MKGGQTSVLIDINHRYPRAYMHRHGLQCPATRPTGFRQQGPAEVHYLCEDVIQMLQGPSANSNEMTVTMCNQMTGKEYSVPKKKIYKKLPHIVADNHFSGENVMQYIGSKGFGMTATCRRDRFPPGLKEFLHHDKVPSTDKRTRVARFEQPILAIKKVKENGDQKAYTQTMVSFQSTSGTNITGVNNLLSLTLYVQPKYRGNKNKKFAWAVEQNEARDIYLNHYYGVDSLDHMIKNTGNKYITWKFWHSPYLHAMSMGIVACYDMYHECCSGDLDESWKVNEKERMSYSEFLLKLSEQMLTYNPSNGVYAGDEKFRLMTKLPKKRRRSKDLTDEIFPETGVTLANLNIARTLPRFCKTIHDIQSHFLAMKNGTNPKTCDVCGESTRWFCTMCKNVPLCIYSNRKWNGARCMFLYHKEDFFGLSRMDYIEVMRKGWGGELKSKKIIETELKNWKPATDAAIERNTRFLNRLRLQDGHESLDTR